MKKAFRVTDRDAEMLIYIIQQCSIHFKSIFLLFFTIRIKKEVLYATATALGWEGTAVSLCIQLSFLSKVRSGYVHNWLHYLRNFHRKQCLIMESYKKCRAEKRRKNNQVEAYTHREKSFCKISMPVSTTLNLFFLTPTCQNK